MKRPLQFELNIENKHKQSKCYQVQPWVNKALDAKENPIHDNNHSCGTKLQVNMNICQNILNRR